MKVVLRGAAFMGMLIASQLAPIVSGHLPVASASSWCAYPTFMSLSINTQNSDTWYVEADAQVTNDCTEEILGQLDVQRKICNWGCFWDSNGDTPTGGKIEYTVDWKNSGVCKSGTNRYRADLTLADETANHIDDYYTPEPEWTCPSPPKTSPVPYIESVA